MSELSKKSGGGDDELQLKVGYVVEHDVFGKGKVTALEGNGVDKKATVFFPKTGSKTLLLKFAKLRVVEEE